MEDSMKIGMVSGWHVHAKDYAKQISQDERAKITAVWDELPERGENWAAELGVPYFADYKAFLASDIDAVVVCSPTNIHPELIISAAKAKKHIFTEKVLCLKYEDALRIKEAIHENGVVFTISYPQKCSPAMLAAKQLAESGDLGQITYARMRNVHNGSLAGWLPEHFYNAEQCGGGAMVDLGAHPMYLLQWFLGEAKKVASTFTNVTDKPVEDNAVSVIEFENGAIGVSETGFVSVYQSSSFEISGTKGALMVRGGALTYATAGTEGKWVPMEELPTAPKLPLFQWIDGVESGKAPEQFDIAEAVKLTKLMEAAYVAYQGDVQAKI